MKKNTITNLKVPIGLEMYPSHKRAYNEQYWYAENFLEEFLEMDHLKPLNILEIGTAEAGLLKYFDEKNHNCYGIEYSEERYKNAINLHRNSNIKIIKGDITKPSSYQSFNNIKYDVIVLRDVIEHVNGQLLALTNIANLLKEGGKFFISFPPKYSPYAGHQQVFKSKFCKLPFLHLLPNFLYRNYLSAFGITREGIDYFLMIKKIRLSISFFLSLTKSIGFKTIKKHSYFIRPNYEFRFNLKRKRNHLSFIPILDELFTMGVLFIISK